MHTFFHQIGFRDRMKKCCLVFYFFLEINIFKYIGITGEMEITISKEFWTGVSAMKALPRTITARKLCWRKKL